MATISRSVSTSPVSTSPTDVKIEEQGSCINNCFKNVFSYSNGILVTVGFFLFGIGLWFVFDDWGNIEPSFFLGMGICVTLSGVIIGCLAWTGQQGVLFQTKIVGTFWSGRKLLAFYNVMLFLIICAELFIIYISLSVLNDLMSTYADIMTKPEDQWPAIDGFEKQIGSKFNLFFFGAATSCQDPKFILLWDFVDKKCPDAISSTRCRGCGDNYITQCYADANQCMDVQNGDGGACAYSICRKNFLTFFIKNLYPIAYAVLAFIVFQIIMFLMGVILLCYTKRDDIEKQLKKTGTHPGSASANTNTATNTPNNH